MKRLINSALIAAVGISALVACGSEETEDKSITIGWLAKGADNDFFDLSRTAAQLAADDLTSTSGRDVEVVLLDSPTKDAEAQVAQIAVGREMGIDGLDISVLDPALATPEIDALVDDGIPVITFDSDAPDSKRNTFYGISNAEGAELAADIMADLMGETGQIVMQTAAASSTSATYQERRENFIAKLEADYPNMEVVTIDHCDTDAENNLAGCTGLLEQAMVDYPDATGYYLARGRVLREADILTLAPNWSAKVLDGTFKVVGFDAPEDALHSVKSGLVHALITQDFFGWGYDVVNLTFDVISSGANLELDSFTNSGLEVVCQNNVDQLIEMWQAQDFRTALDKCDLL